jgi:hypothetical protein
MAVVGDRDEPAPLTPQQSAAKSDGEWAKWVYGGEGNARRPGWDSIPRNF